MIIVNIAFLLMIAGCYICSLKGSKELLASIDKKEHKLYFLYPMSKWLLAKTRLEKILLRKSKISDAVRALNITGKPETLQKLYWYSKTSLVLLILFLFNVLSIFGSLSSKEGQGILTNQQLTRPDYGEGDKEVHLSVEIDNEERKDTSGKADNTEDNKNSFGNNTSTQNIQEDNDTSKESGYSKKTNDSVQDDYRKDIERNSKKKDSYTEDITILNKELEYTEEELEKAMNNAILYIDRKVLGKNKSEDNIREDLNFITGIPDTSIRVEWEPDNTDLITKEGKVNNKNTDPEGVSIDPEGISTKVTAMLIYGEKKREHPIRFTVFPKLLSEEEKLLKELNTEIEKENEKTSINKKWKLPSDLKNYSLSWKEKKQDTGKTLFILGIIMAAGIWFLYDRDLDSRMKKRKEQMLLDYPEIINKFTLLVNAGMTTKQAWGKITEDYLIRYGDRVKNKRYAYEEMLVTVHELKLGTPEEYAYEKFGRRSGILPYIKFSSLIAQNLKKGNKGLTDLLSREALEAFEDRKSLAKQLGEEAGTKLLGPMMIMLIIVLIIIIIPAFMAFKA